MAIGRTANPALNKKTFTNLSSSGADRMTLHGTANKAALLLLILVATGSLTWAKAIAAPSMEGVVPWLIGGAIGGLVVAMITIFKKTWAPFTTPLYAAFEGLFLGAISALFERMYPGIVMQAVMLTAAVFFGLLFAYKTRIIRATENFKLGVFAATSAIALVYLVSIVLGLFGVRMPFLHDSGPIGIGISLIIVVVAALNLVLDFDFIEEGAEKGAPKYMEWYGAFGLLVTLVWLYLELLRLLAKLRD